MPKGKSVVTKIRRGTVRRAATLIVALLAVVSGRAWAQLVSDSVPQDRIVPAKEQLDSDLANSRYRLGPVRLLPSFEVSNAGYNNNVFGQPQNPQSDFTATVNVGTQLIIPLGAKVYFLGDAFPGYSWYAKFSNLNSFTGTAGASVAGYFNRLSFEVGARGTEAIVVQSEVPTPTLAKTGHAFARIDVKLTPVLALFTQAEGAEVRESQPGVPLPDRSLVERYNRTDEAIEGGFRYSLGSSWTIRPEVQYTTTRFVLTPEERNNTSLGYLLGVSFNRQRFYLNLVGGYREGRPYQGSTFPQYSTPVGSYFVSYFLRPWLEVRSFGQRRVAYSVDFSNPYYFGMLVNGTLNIQVSPRVLLKGFGGVGQNKYPIPQFSAGAEVNRLDRLSNYGGGVSFIVLKNLTLTGLATQKIDVSNIPSASYSTLQYSTYLTFTGDFMR